MNCKRAKAYLALLIGNDLEPETAREIRKHVDGCEVCRRHLRQLTACLDVLQAPANLPWNPESDSLWPRLSVRLASQSEVRPPHRLNGWAPTVVVAVACSAMFWIASRQFPSDPVRVQSDIRSQPVSNPSAFDVPVSPYLFEQPNDDWNASGFRANRSSQIPLVPINQSR